MTYDMTQSSVAQVIAPAEAEPPQVIEPDAQPAQKTTAQAQFRLPEPSSVFEEIKPLVRKLALATPFPTGALGTILGAAVKKASEVVQAPEALTGNSFLAAAALIAQSHINVSVDGRLHPASEFFATVAASGDRKDTTDNIAFDPIYMQQQLLLRRHQESSQQFVNASDGFNKARALAVSRTNGQEPRTREELTHALELVGDEPERPIEPVKVITDFTIEGLTKYLENGQPSVAIVATEGGQILGGHGFSKDNILKTAAGLSKFWDGRPVSRLRSMDGAIALYDRRVSMHLMIQPVVAPLLVNNTLLAGQGTLSRILLTWPESLVGSRLSIHDDLPPSLTLNAEELQRYRQQANTLLALPEPIKPGTRNELAPRAVCLTQPALKLWRAFYNDTERQQASNGKLCEIRGLASKIAEHAARLAGIIAFFENAEVFAIDVDAINGGIALAQHYLDEALRLHGTGSVDQSLQEAQKLYAWLDSKGQREITLVEIYQRGPNLVRDAKRARVLVNILVEHGLMAPLDGGLVFDGATRKEAFQVRLGVS